MSEMSESFFTQYGYLFIFLAGGGGGGGASHSIWVLPESGTESRV